MAADALLARGGELAELSPRDARGARGSAAAGSGRVGNPSTCSATRRRERFGGAVEAVLADRRVDAVLVILTPQAMTDADGDRRGGGGAPRRSKSPQAAAGRLDGRALGRARGSSA